MILNEEAEEYEWVALNRVDNYDLGGFIKALLDEIKNKKESEHKTEIFYGY